jgi:hemolysin activation/secretion protein
MRHTGASALQLRVPGVLLAWAITGWNEGSAQVREPVTRPAASQNEVVDEPSGLPPIPRDDDEGDGGGGGANAVAAAPESVPVTAFRFAGNTVFTGRQLGAAPVADAQRTGEPEPRAVATVADYVGRPLTTEDLEDVRLALTRLYVDAGYINSGAVLPDQDVTDGVVRFDLVEGRLTGVNVTGNKRLRRGYVVSRVRHGAGRPLNVLRLRNQLEVLRQDPNLARVVAELRPGAEPGDAYLDIDVVESNPFQLGLQIGNRRSPSVGAEQVEVLASHRNVTGHGDLLSLRYGVNTGGFDAWEFAGLDDFSIDYTVPITAADTTLSLSYTRTDSLVVEEPFDVLGITSASDSAAVTLRHPFHRSANAEFAMSVGLAYRDNQTELLGEAFSFSPGAEDGRSVVAPLRVGQEFTARSQLDALALRSTFSIGTGLFDATLHGGGDTPDGHYLAWLAQAQYVRRVNLRPHGLQDFFRPDGASTYNPLADGQLVLRGSAQVASDPLLATEQFAVGGVDTVRGYRENQLVRDSGLAGSLELRVPLIATAGGARVLDVVPFVDLGYADDVDGDSEGEFLSSVGVGLVFAPNRHLSAQVYYGYALNRDVNEETDDLQDAGIHFNLLVLAF